MPTFLFDTKNNTLYCIQTGRWNSV